MTDLVARKVYSLISIWTYARRLVIFRAIIIRAIIKRSIPAPDGTTPPLVHKMPVEACERTMLSALVLQEERTLFDAKLLQVT